jgi:hypothetical protein
MDSNMPNSIDPYLNQKSGVAGVDRRFDQGSVIDQNYERDSWKDMAQNFYTDVTRLLEKEGQLIRTEMNEKISQAKVATVSMVTSGVLLFVGALCLAATAIIVLDLFAPLWLAAAVVTVALLAIGGIMFTGAKKKLNTTDLKPNKSIQAIGEIRHSLQEKVHEITKH